MKRFALVILLPVLLLYGCYRLSYPRYVWHERLELVVQTPEGEKRGAAVILSRRSITPKTLPDASVIGGGIEGEATMVDLGGGRYLFALLKGRDGLVSQVFHDRLPRDARPRALIGALAALRAKAPVPPEYYPLLVTFGDINDPASVRRVDPADLAATFGAGFALREITLEVTDDAVTEGVIEGVLGAWLNMVKGRAPSDARDIPALHLPNDSPRGWVNLGALSFWSLDTVMELKEKYK